jgi:hypothetical protein
MDLKEGVILHLDTDGAPLEIELLDASKMVSGEPKDDLDAKSLMKVPDIDYENLRHLVKKYLGTGTANRLDVFAREVGLLPPKGSYKESGPSL